MEVGHGEEAVCPTDVTAAAGQGRVGPGHEPSLGQSAGYINNIENGVNLPSMSTFFYICEYLGVTPEEFFAAELADPVRLLSLSKSLRRLSSRQLELLEQLVQEMK